MSGDRDPCNIDPRGMVMQAVSFPRVAVDPRIDPDEATAIIVLCGQSNIASTMDVTYSPVNKVHNLSLMEGGVYEAEDPLLGDTIYNHGTDEVPLFHGIGNFMTRTAELLIDAEFFDRVILLPAAYAGSSSDDWAPGGFLYPRIEAVAARLAGYNYAPTFLMWSQGNTDAIYSVPKATYKANTRAIFQRFRDVGIGCPIFIFRESAVGGADYLGLGSADIHAGQNELIDNLSVFAGPDADNLIDLSGRQPDGLHYDGSGGTDLAVATTNDTLGDYMRSRAGVWLRPD